MDRTFRKNYVGLFFICIAFFTSVACAGNDEELFLNGNQYYMQEDYDSAFRSYEMMSEKGRAVSYNMGNCSYHKGDYAQALGYWSRAEYGATNQEQIIISRNKDHVFKLINTQGEQSSGWKVLRSLCDFKRNFSELLLQLLFLFCWYIFTFFICKNQVKMKIVIVGFLSIFMLVSGASLLGLYCNRNEHGIVIKKGGELLVGPNKGFHAISPVSYAENVIVKEIREGWYKVRYADMIGWVEADVIQII